MSISSAPSATASRTSASFTSIGDWPDGNAVATEATLTPEPASRSLRDGDEVRVDADRRDRRESPGRRDRAASPSRRAPTTLPGVSAPSSVVRSIIRIARSSAASFDVLLDRALRELAGARLERDRVDRADPRQPQVERKLEITREQLCLSHRRQV